MTSSQGNISLTGRPQSQRLRTIGRWQLEDAKARFSELVRHAQTDGPQHVTVHGRDEVVVVSAEDFNRLTNEQTGAALVAAFRTSPHGDIELAPERESMPVRDVDL